MSILKENLIMEININCRKAVEFLVVKNDLIQAEKILGLARSTNENYTSHTPFELKEVNNKMLNLIEAHNG